MHFVVAVQQLCGNLCLPPHSWLIMHSLLLSSVPLTMSVADEASDQVYVPARAVPHLAHDCGWVCNSCLRTPSTQLKACI
ncbi:hypothetical protein ACLKA7_015168 [Drosophila subpalustris]